jgi:putative ATP-dependent endonuclease of OLD family
VEGDAENLLLPVLANLLGLPLNKHGVSIINVGTVGLFRYSRIFQSADRKARVPVRVACITDLDLPHDASLEKKNTRRAIRRRNEGGTVRTFVSPYTTLEYDLATSFAREMHMAIALAKVAKSTGGPVSDDARPKIEEGARTEFAQLQQDCASDKFTLATRIYEPLTSKKKEASKAETAQYFAESLITANKRGELDSASLRERLPQYLVNAIEYVTWTKDFPPRPPQQTTLVDIADHAE